MKKETKKKCKHICIECDHCYNVSDTKCCIAYPKTTIVSCVTGEETSCPALCAAHNKTGCCNKFKQLPYVRLKKLLIRYIKDNPLDWCCRTTTEVVVAKDLLSMLEGAESELVEGIYTGDSPYDYSIIVTEKAVEEAMRKRRYRKEAKESGELYQ